jgi:hypothetical protein
MNRPERRRADQGKAKIDVAVIKALDKNALEWLANRMQEPDAKTKTAQELVEEYWQSIKDKK